MPKFHGEWDNFRIWGGGMSFAYSGYEGPTVWGETLVGFTAQYLGICVQLPAKAQLDFRAEDELISVSECQLQLATGDLIEGTYRGEAFCFGSLSHDLWAGKIPGSWHVSLAGQKSGYALRQGAGWFMLAAGKDEEDAAAKVPAVSTEDWETVWQNHRKFYQ